MATRLRKMGYQEKVLSIVLKVKSAGFRRRDHQFRQSDHGFRSQDHGFRRMARFGRNKSESAVELNRKVRSDYIGINGRFGSEYANPKFRVIYQPIYSPWVNHVERLWQALHDTITRNHQCRSMWQLLKKVRHFMETASPFPGGKHGRAKV